MTMQKVITINLNGNAYQHDEPGYQPSPARVSHARGGTAPPLAAGFALTMLAGTPSGDAFTLRDLQGMLTAAGFGQASAHPLPGPPTIVGATL